MRNTLVTVSRFISKAGTV